jgi:CheY-like chemotaxis protein/anti-sigma regulatory factor (Ser/Thr protein kinase)
VGSSVVKTDELSDIQGQFLASLNHEIRTPLSGILGMTDLLLETPLSEDQQEYVAATRLCAESLLEILNVTLEYSALSASHVHLEKTEFPLRQTLEAVVAEHLSKAKAKGLQLLSQFDTSLPETAIGDALRLKQLLGHLLNNAIKFTQRGEVEVSASVEATSESAPRLKVQIRDTGIGIPSEQLTKIFDSFRQLDTGLTRSHGGLGLGLAVAHKLAALLHGSVTVESEVGKGSTFQVDLPLRLPSESILRPVEALRVRGRVLVVDDNAMAQTVASHALRRQSFEVECAGGGLDAVDAASKSHFDVILMDLQMPGLDGFQTVERIRKLPGYVDTPIIAVTANCSNDYRDRCANCGMQDFLAKPVRTRELVQTVEKYLEAS